MVTILKDLMIICMCVTSFNNAVLSTVELIDVIAYLVGG